MKVLSCCEKGMDNKHDIVMLRLVNDEIQYHATITSDPQTLTGFMSCHLYKSYFYQLRQRGITIIILLSISRFVEDVSNNT